MHNKNQYIKIHRNKADVQLEILVLKNKDSVIAYCPALDLSTYGDEHENIIKLFEENLIIFFEETCKNGTLENELIRLQWKLLPEKYEPQKESFKDIKYEVDKVVDREMIKESFSVPSYCMA
ncbi:hypothetical protein BH10BAC5_BH10BAC5_28890 [soil metagenome]